MNMLLNDMQPGCESWICHLSNWWHGLSHHHQNLVVGVGALIVVLLVVALAGALGLNGGPHWVWNVPN